MLKKMWQFIILRFFRRLVDDGLEYCDIKIVVRGRRDKINVFMTTLHKEGEETGPVDLAKYLE